MLDRTCARAFALMAWLIWPVMARPASSTVSVEPELARLADRAAAAAQGPQNIGPARTANALAVKLAGEGKFAAAGQAERYSGLFSVMAGDTAAAANAFERSAAWCRRVGDDDCVGRALNNAGVAVQGAGDFVSAVRDLTGAAKAFQRENKPALASTTRLNATIVQGLLGDYAGALASYTAIERDYPANEFMVGLLVNKANMLLKLHRPAEAEATARDAVPLADRGVSTEGVVGNMKLITRLTVAQSLAAEGRAKLALAGLKAARAWIGPGGRDAFVFANQCLEIHDALGTMNEALPCAKTALPLLATDDARTQEDVLALAAKAYAATGDTATAYRLQRRALESATERQRSELTAATARAMADIGVAERDTLVDQLTVKRAQESAHANRIGLVAALALAVLILIGGAIGTRARIVQLRHRQGAVLEERMRIARELHDTLITGFTGVALQLQAAAKVAARSSDPGLRIRIEDLAHRSTAILSDARGAVWQMRSPLIETGDLRGAIEAWMATLQKNGPELVCDLARLPSLRERRAIETLLRVVQEAVSNALHHAGATRITVRASYAGDEVKVSVADDGRGFDPEAVGAEGRWGLRGMRERVEQAGGKLTIASAPGCGTTVTAGLPLPA